MISTPSQDGHSRSSTRLLMECQCATSLGRERWVQHPSRSIGSFPWGMTASVGSLGAWLHLEAAPGGRIGTALMPDSRKQGSVSIPPGRLCFQPSHFWGLNSRNSEVCGHHMTSILRHTFTYQGFIRPPENTEHWIIFFSTIMFIVTMSTSVFTMSLKSQKSRK